jgi:hypothetical protein
VTHYERVITELERAKRIQTYRVYSASDVSVGESLFPEKEYPNTPCYSDVVTT